MLAKLGTPAWFGSAKGGKFMILGQLCNCRESYTLGYLEQPSGFAVVDDQYIGTHIETFERVEQLTTVYNFSVEEDESYLTVGGTVHNCTQFLNWARENEILVRADEMSAALEEAATFKHKTQSVAEQYGV